ncbi:MAG: hypothetical protein HYX63_02320 [Gammaproteobacteria bacterium]|nr:hypothetical protein [Gammaproteobacteria bacterium]
MHIRSCTLGLVCATAISSAFGCDFCLISQGISPLQSLSGAGLRVNERYSVLGSVYQGTDEVTNPNAREEFWTTEISGFYGVSEDFLLMLNVPVRSTHGDGGVSTGAEGNVALDTARGGDDGAGDIAAFGRYTFLRHHALTSTTLVAATLGVKLPSGSTEGRDDNGGFLDAHIQLGTGSTDILMGLSASHAIDRFSLAANVLASITTEGEFGATPHQFGDSLNYDITAKYRVLPTVLNNSSMRWFISLGVNGECRGHEHEEGVLVFDSGGHVLYITPGLQAIIGKKWIFETTYQAAIFHDLNGTQLGEDYKVTGSLTYLF